MMEPFRIMYHRHEIFSQVNNFKHVFRVGSKNFINRWDNISWEKAKILTNDRKCINATNNNLYFEDGMRKS